jgi:hypothetical protein
LEFVVIKVVVKVVAVTWSVQLAELYCSGNASRRRKPGFASSH